MKAITITLLVSVVMAVPSGAAVSGRDRPAPRMSANIDNQQYINANNILMFVTNYGGFGRDLSGIFGYDAWTYFPYDTVADIQDGNMINTCLYASGLWVGGQVSGETRVAVAELGDRVCTRKMVLLK